MKSLQQLLLVFVVVQSAFVALDAATLWRDRAAGAAPLRGVWWGSLVFLAGVWLAYFAIQAGLMALLPSVERTLAATAAILDVPVSASDAATPAAPLWSLAALLGATYVVAGFWDYVFHRGLLHSRWGWVLHENHHLPTVVANGMPGISVRPFVGVTTFLTSCCTTATLLAGLRLTAEPALLHAFVSTLPAMILFFTLVGSASHSAFLRTLPQAHAVLRWLAITTPQEHILHHAARLQGNYGNFTTLWDRLLGTYLDPHRHGAGPRRLGLGYDQDFLGTLTAGRWKLPQGVREKYRLDAFCYLTGRPSR